MAAKHRGAWKPSGKSTLEKLMAKKRPKAQKPANRAIPVVMIDRSGAVLERFESVVSAAARCGRSEGFVTERCSRRLSARTDEFAAAGASFRWADKWEKLSEAEKREDICNVYLEEERESMRCGRYYEWQGEKHTLAEWSRIVNLPENILRNRIRSGWDFERAIKTPAPGLAAEE